MKRFRGRKPSPAMVISTIALIFALAGTAMGGVATISVLTKKERKQARNIAKDEIAKAAPGLTTSSASNQVGGFFSLPGSFEPVASATVTTHGAGRVLATGSVSLFSPTGSGTAGCRIVIDGEASLDYHAASGAAPNQAVIAVNHAVSRPAGTYTATLLCRTVAGTISKLDAGINVYGLGA